MLGDRARARRLGQPECFGDAVMEAGLRRLLRRPAVARTRVDVRALSLAFTSAPRSRRFTTAAVSPRKAANISGVLPFTLSFASYLILFKNPRAP
jgi:hypothetical protein